LCLGIGLGVAGTTTYIKFFSSKLDTSAHVNHTPPIEEGLKVESVSWRLVEERREGKSSSTTAEVLCLWKITVEPTMAKPGMIVVFLLYDRYNFELATDKRYIGPLSTGAKQVVQGRFWLGSKIAALAHHASIRLATASKEKP
jgi:hypothetical protein